MKKKSAKRFALPILILAVGIAWALNIAQLLPGVNWIWICSLAALGLFSLLSGRFSRSNLVTGGLFLSLASCEILRQSSRLEFKWEIPLLVILLGFFMLLAQLLPLPDASANEKEK